MREIPSPQETARGREPSRRADRQGSHRERLGFENSFEHFQQFDMQACLK
jgi:hypothetical protein